MKKMVNYSGLIFILFFYGSLQAQIFAERAIELGIEHHMYDPNAMGGGVAIFDFNNDGFEDIYLTGGLNDDKLYENLGDGSFADVTKKMRITAFSIVKTMGVMAGDIDNDGYTDLLVTTAEGHPCYLLKNEGGKSFKNISKAAGIDHDAWNMTATMADYDLDGYLDIYVGNYVEFSDIPFDQNITNAEEDFFYRNNGNSTFEKLENPLAYDKRGCTLVASFSDYDQDGDSDLFVLNDFGDFYQSNKLLQNNFPADSFEEITDSSGMNAEINSMGIAVADFNEDGNFDYYITNIGDNLLYEGLGDSEFRSISHLQQVDDGTGVSWGTTFFDANNDSYLDLFVAKGTLLKVDDPQGNRFYLGKAGEVKFDDVSETQKLDDPNKGRGMAMGDFNNDGKQDFAVINIRMIPENKGNALLYMNKSDSNGNWLKVNLSGTVSNKSAYGAIVKVYAEDRQFVREISGGSSYLSHHSKNAHFGLGSIQKIDSLVVNWPSKNGKEVFKNLDTNISYSIIENENIYRTISEVISICPNEPILLDGEMRNTEGVYHDIIEDENGGIATLKTTKLIVLDPKFSDCEIVLNNETEGSIVIFYPNPFEDTITISGGLELLGLVEILVSDTSGCIIKNETMNAEGASNTLELKGYGNLPAGIYVIRITSNGKSYQRNLIKS